MLQCRQATSESTMAAVSSDMTVLDRQQLWIKQQLQQHTTSSSSYHNTSLLDNSAFQIIASYLDGDDTTNKKHNPNHGNEILGWPDLVVGSHPMLTTSFVDMVNGGGNGGEIASPTSKKRKGDEAPGRKVSVDPREDNMRMKKAKGDSEYKKAAVGIKESNNQNSEVKEDMIKAAVAEPPPKTDYIHVRARRGQATDSHSLAERVRREKIGERMKYLQDLVPGCNRITGKAGMLDEIINYVQSLQRQVEFLSMKLATVHPRLDFSIDQLLGKEINPANSNSFPTTIGISSSEIVDPSYLQFNPMGDAVSCCGLQTTVNSSELALSRTATTLVPVTADTSCINIHGSSFPWDHDIQNLYNVEFHQGRGFPLPVQLFQGNMLPNHPKMEL